MPAKTSVKKSGKKAVKKKAIRKPAEKKAVAPVKSMSICESCHAFPVGSVELVSLLLVLVFSLTAVLVTSVHSIALKDGEINALQAKITNG